MFIGARFSDVTLAANEVLIQFMYITAYAMDGFAFAAETLIARAYGRGDPMRVRRSALMTSLWGMVICVTTALGFLLAGPWLIDLMAKDVDVQIEARGLSVVDGCCPIGGLCGVDAGWHFHRGCAGT